MNKAAKVSVNAMFAKEFQFKLKIEIQRNISNFVPLFVDLWGRLLKIQNTDCQK